MQRIAVMLALALAACVTVNATVLNDRSAYPVPPVDVQVFLPDDDVPESCERVAILHGRGDVDWTDRTQMLDELRKKAGELGANAVHVLSMEDPGTGERIVAGIFETSADRDADALALWCVED